MSDYDDIQKIAEQMSESISLDPLASPPPRRQEIEPFDVPDPAQDEHPNITPTARPILDKYGRRAKSVTLIETKGNYRKQQNKPSKPKSGPKQQSNKIGNTPRKLDL